jgi:outer membrane receptor protein involved in Fe transport
VKKIFVTIAMMFYATMTLVGQETNVITGTVTDVHGDAIAGATIRCGERTVIADAEGKFRFTDAHCDLATAAAAGFEASSALSSAEIKFVLHPSSLSLNVTVSGTSTPLAETPASVTVMDRRRLETSGAVTLDDRLRQVPGFSLFRRTGSRTANPTAQGASLRGVGASGASRAIVLKDGVPLNDQFGSWVYWGRVPSESISEVEIARGPASDLYGTAAVGGVVSVLTREIGESPFASVDLSYGTEQTPFGSAFASGRHHDWGGSLAAEYFKTDGFIPVATEQRGPVDTLANVRRSAVVPTIERRFGSVSRLFATGEFYREVRANGTPLQSNDTRINNFVGGGEFPLEDAGEITFRAFGGWEQYHQSFSAIAANRNAEFLNRLQTVPSQVYGASARWLLARDKNTYFAGVEYRNIRGRSDETGITNGVATVATSAGGRESSFAAYAGALLRPFERLTLSGGIRYDNWHEKHGYSSSRSLISNTSSYTAFPDRGRDAVSPRGSVLFRIDRHFSLAGTVAGGFRQPTLNELYRSFRVGNVLTLSNEELRAERAINGEASVIVNAFDERFYLRAGPYCTRISDTVSNVTIDIMPNLITRERQNIGVTRSCGFEADALFRATPELTINAGYLHVDAKVREMPGNAPLVGKRLLRCLAIQGSVQVQYSRSKIGTFSMQMRAASEQFDDDLNLLPLKAFFAADVFASHAVTRRTSVYFAGENIFDARIEAGRTPVLTLAQPRNGANRPSPPLWR